MIVAETLIAAATRVARGLEAPDLTAEQRTVLARSLDAILELGFELDEVTEAHRRGDGGPIVEVACRAQAVVADLAWLVGSMGGPAPGEEI